MVYLLIYNEEISILQQTLNIIPVRYHHKFNFSKIFTTDTLQFTHDGKVWAVLRGSNLHMISIVTVLCAISCYIGLCYLEIQLYRKPAFNLSLWPSEDIRHYNHRHWLIHWPLGDREVILKGYLSKSFYNLISCTLPLKFVSGECH